MPKKMFTIIVILSIGLICSIVFLGVAILYGFSHQATKHGGGLDFEDDRLYPYSEFVIEKIDN